MMLRETEVYQDKIGLQELAGEIAFSAHRKNISPITEIGRRFSLWGREGMIKINEAMRVEQGNGVNIDVLFDPNRPEFSYLQEGAAASFRHAMIGEVVRNLEKAIIYGTPIDPNVLEARINIIFFNTGLRAGSSDFFSAQQGGLLITPKQNKEMQHILFDSKRLGPILNRIDLLPPGIAQQFHAKTRGVNVFSDEISKYNIIEAATVTHAQRMRERRN